MRRLAMSGGHRPKCCADRWGIGEISAPAPSMPPQRWTVRENPGPSKATAQGAPGYLTAILRARR